MTSEVKPFAYAYIGTDGQPDGDRFGTQPLSAGDIKAGYTQIELYTRALPDVPELVRYRMDVDIDILHPIVEPDGEYVLYSQAAAKIAAKDGVQQQWQDIAKHHTGYENPSMAFRVLLERAEGAEAKLAELRAENDRLRGALNKIANSDTTPFRVAVFAEATLNPSESQK